VSKADKLTLLEEFEGLSEDEQFDGALKALLSLPFAEQWKLIYHLSKKDLPITQTKLFVKWAEQHHDLKI
jgi:hypothetical protein